jgi:hypothetical protein
MSESNCNTLVIEGVDLELLEKQRLALAELLGSAAPRAWRDSEEVELCNGLLTMLDHWADDRDGVVWPSPVRPSNHI